MKILRKLFRKKIKIHDGRRYKRIRAAYLVKYQIEGKGEQPRITNARDIGAGGLRFWTEEKLPEASVLKVSIFLPPLGRSVEAVAQVLRVRRAKKGIVYYVAVSFLDLKKEDRQAINTFAETLSKDKDARVMIDRAEVIVRK